MKRVIHMDHTVRFLNLNRWQQQLIKIVAE